MWDVLRNGICFDSLRCMSVLGASHQNTIYYCASQCIAPMPLAPAQGRGRRLTPGVRGGHYWWSAPKTVDGSIGSFLKVLTCPVKREVRPLPITAWIGGRGFGLVRGMK